MNTKKFYNSGHSKDDFIEASIGDLECEYNFAGSGFAGRANLISLYEYVANRRGTIYLHVEGDHAVYEGNFWDTALQHLKGIYAQQRAKSGSPTPVTAHTTTAIGWTDREQARRCYFEVGEKSVFCDSDGGFYDLCEALNIPVTNDDED